MKTPAENVIDKMGGLTKLARALGFAVSTVQGWKVRGRIPQEHWAAIMSAGAANGVTVEVDDFFAEGELTANRFDRAMEASGARVTDDAA